MKPAHKSTYLNKKNIFTRAACLLFCLGFLAAVLAVLPVMQVSAAEPRPIPVTNEEELKKAIQDAAPLAVISIADDIEIPLSATLIIPTGKTITLTAAKTGTLSPGEAMPVNAPLVQVNNGAFLSFTGGGCLTGGTNRTASLVLNKGTLVLDGWHLATNGSSTDDTRPAKGGGIVNSGTLIMQGTSKITNCHAFQGGAVYLDKNSRFTFSSGTIGGPTSNFANTAGVSGGRQGQGGGIYIAENAQLTMGGAQPLLSGCLAQGSTAGNTTGGQGGGVYIAQGGQFTFTQGTISGNTASGSDTVASSSSTASSSDSTASGTDATALGSSPPQGLGGGIFNASAGNGTTGGLLLQGGAIGGSAAGLNLAGFGGGIYNAEGAHITFTSGTIAFNKALNGGGIYNIGHCTFSGGSITNNIASENGGGVFTLATENKSASFTMSGGSTAANSAGSSAQPCKGGSLYFNSTNGVLTAAISGGSISGVASAGGGIYADGTSQLALSGAPRIGQQSPPSGLGYSSTAQINIGSMLPTAIIYLEAIPNAANGTVFANASGSSTQPLDATCFYYLPGALKPVAGANASTFTLSNAGCRIRYNPEGGNVNGLPASQDQLAGTAYTIPSAPTRAGYTFEGWNTRADGSGFTLTAGQTLTVYNDLTLYALWAALPAPPPAAETFYRVMYDVNHSNLGTSQIHDQTGYRQGETVTLRDTKPTRKGYTFTGWNTAANGTGTPYKPLGSMIISSDTYLYAQWAPVVSSAPSSQAASSKPAASSSTASASSAVSAPSVTEPSEASVPIAPPEQSSSAPAKTSSASFPWWIVFTAVAALAAAVLIVILLNLRKTRHDE